MNTLFNFELNQWKNQQIVCGVDEVGRGCLAGPIVTAALILNKNSMHSELQDSKCLSHVKLKKIYKWIIKNSTYCIGISNNRAIDALNIYQATKTTMKKAILGLSSQKKPSIIVIDAMPISLENTTLKNIPVESWIKGESKSATIAAASIVAKVTRDTILENMHQNFPCYELCKHKGYATVKHRAMLQTKNASIVHRQSFLTKIIGNSNNDNQQQSIFC